MKKEFPGYFTSAEANKNLWDECIFVFDANILLNLYRYSDATRESLLEMLESLKERVWIPHQVALEYLGNRVKVILDQGAEYQKTIQDISKLKEKLENSRAHPFIKEDTLGSVSSSLEIAIRELEDNKRQYENRITADEIRERVAGIFENRIGEEIERNELENIILEGADRYKEKIPPGYSDIKKQGEEDNFASKLRPYGDLIIWKSLINKAEQEKKSVIFVTGDQKEDWWLKGGGKTLGPKPELVKEFRGRTDKEFHMYLPERFLEFATDRMKGNTPKEVLDEIRTTRVSDLERKEIINMIKNATQSISKNSVNFKIPNQLLKSVETHHLTDRLEMLRIELEDSQKKERQLIEKTKMLENDLAFHKSMYGSSVDEEDPNYDQKRFRVIGLTAKELENSELELNDRVARSASIMQQIKNIEFMLNGE